jgi:DNA polymerase I-like protein with 3'-5' exonuclease and polymerase domains
LSGGDFDAFEVTIADATYNDPALRADLMSDTKIHAVMGGFLYDMTYDEVMATKNLTGEDNKYTKGKSAIFALFYGGDEGTLVRKSGVSLDKAKEGYAKFVQKYPVMGKGRAEVVKQHTCMEQPKGIGSKISWKDPADYVESMFGFKRYFTLENRVCRALFDLANDPPKDWKIFQETSVTRRDKVQSSLGAARSALFGAAFNVMSSNIRAALNHKIQSSGATPMKVLQNRIWQIQPSGSHPWKVRNMQVHDELLAVHTPEATDEIIKVKDSFLDEYKHYIPLLNITWLTKMSSWANTH